MMVGPLHGQDTSAATASVVGASLSAEWEPERIQRNLSHPTPRRFKKALERELGADLDMVILFGSRAMGHSTADLPWEVAILVTREAEGQTEALNRAVRAATEGSRDHVAAVLIGPNRMARGGPLFEHLAQHGVPLL